MASASAQHVLLSPAELAYLHSSLSLTPPIRPDGRTPTQFRPLIAETGILPGTNGSARICFADGTEAIVGVKAEVAKTKRRHGSGDYGLQEKEVEEEEEPQKLDEGEGASARVFGEAEWVEMTVEIPGLRDDDANTIFLAEMLSEALLADGEFVKKLWINSRFHWKLYLDVILISPPLSYPLPLLSLTIHLALLATRLPRLKSEGDEDPLFDDDWDASPFLYSGKNKSRRSGGRPPVTLLVTAVGDSILFDPSKEELAVAEVAVAISVAEAAPNPEQMEVDSNGRNLRLLSVRMIDPPSRLTASASPVTAAITADGAAATAAAAGRAEVRFADSEASEGAWKPPRGGTRVAVLNAIVQKVMERAGITDEVLDALEAVELG